jgi:hypothetical protein
MNCNRNLKVLFATLIVVGLTTPSVWGIARFARKHNLTCSSCHTAVPYLNATGRSYKEAGYILPDEDGEIDWDTQPSMKISEYLDFDREFPISARIKGYIVDDKSNSDTKIRPLHEVEIFSGGNFAKRGSWFFELEGEDEDDFDLIVAGSFNWRFDQAANLSLGYGSIFHSDPYNSLQDGGRRMTVSHKFPLDVGSGVDARFRKDSQFINFFGRANRLYYSAGISSGNGNPEGVDPNDYFGRLAYDITPGHMIGAFVFDGERSDADPSMTTDISRWGIDFDLNWDDIHLVGMWMDAEEELLGITESNDAYYIEFYYTHQRNNRPFFVPVVRYDLKEANDGKDDVAALSAQLGFFVVENFKLALEYYDELDQVPGKTKGDRVTLLADLSF